MIDLINRDLAIDALNESDYIKGFAYTQMHDALMEIQSIKTKEVKYFDEDENVWKIGSVIIDEN